MASVQGAAAPTCSFSLLPSPLPFSPLLSPNPLTSQFPGAGRPPEEGQPAAGSRCWVVARQLLAAVLLLGLSLGSPVLLVYLLRSCGPGKQGPGARSALPQSVAGPVCPSPRGPMPTDLIIHHPRSVPFPVVLPLRTPTLPQTPARPVQCLGPPPARRCSAWPLGGALAPLSQRCSARPLGGALAPPSQPRAPPAGACDSPACRALLARALASRNASASAAPCADFFSFACGEARGSRDPFQALAEENKRRLRGILGKGRRAAGPRRAAGARLPSAPPAPSLSPAFHFSTPNPHPLSCSVTFALLSPRSPPCQAPSSSPSPLTLRFCLSLPSGVSSRPLALALSPRLSASGRQTLLVFCWPSPGSSWPSRELAAPPPPPCSPSSQSLSRAGGQTGQKRGSGRSRDRGGLVHLRLGEQAPRPGWKRGPREEPWGGGG